MDLMSKHAYLDIYESTYIPMVMHNIYVVINERTNVS